MIDMLHRHAVPLLVFSAGIGDILIEAIKIQSTFYEDNMHVVSNCMEFDEQVSDDWLIGWLIIDRSIDRSIDQLIDLMIDDCTTLLQLTSITLVWNNHDLNDSLPIRSDKEKPFSSFQDFAFWDYWSCYTNQVLMISSRQTSTIWLTQKYRVITVWLFLCLLVAWHSMEE